MYVWMCLTNRMLLHYFLVSYHIFFQGKTSCSSWLPNFYVRDQLVGTELTFLNVCLNFRATLFIHLYLKLI